MKTAKLFANGQSQAIRLPKEYRFSGSEVGITHLGEMVVLFPKEKKDELFFSSLGKFTEDVFETINSARKTDHPEAPRELIWNIY